MKKKKHFNKKHMTMQINNWINTSQHINSSRNEKEMEYKESKLDTVTEKKSIITTKVQGKKLIAL